MRASDNQSFNKFWRGVRILLVRRHTLNRSLSREINHLQDDAPSLPASVRSAGTIVFIFKSFHGYGRSLGATLSSSKSDRLHR